MNLMEQIESNGVVSVIRGANVDNILPIVDALYEGGVRTIEITMESPNALDSLKKIVAIHWEKLIIGAGTVLDPETARAAILAGAQFIFSPTVNKETIKLTKRYGKISIPGAFTATEILTAYEHGADIVKVFPAGVLGAGYIKDIHGPLPHIPLMPTGGVDIENVSDYIKAGSVAVGIGSSLVRIQKDMDATYLESLKKKAAQFTQAVNEARS